MLEASSTEDLKFRWEHLYPKYKAQIEDLQVLLQKISITYNELELIQKELSSRNIEVNMDER